MSALPRPAATLLLLAAGLAVLWLSAARPAARSATVDQAELAGATGRISVENKRKGRALLVAPRLAPGGSATGSIVLRNRGSRPVILRLDQSILSAKPGRGGARLTSVLQLTVREDDRGTIVFRGAIKKLVRRTLRRLPAKGSRRYTFTVSLPRALGNRYQAASLVVRYRWTGSGVPGSTGGTPFDPAGSPRRELRKSP